MGGRRENLAQATPVPKQLKQILQPEAEMSMPPPSPMAGFSAAVEVMQNAQSDPRRRAAEEYLGGLHKTPGFW